MKTRFSKGLLRKELVKLNRFLLCGLWLAVVAWQGYGADATPVYRDTTASPEVRTEDLLKRMTLEEKIDYIGGTGFSIRPIPRLHIPEIMMSDGPQGCRCYGNSPAYAGGIAVAASWDPELARRVGASIGRDFRARGVHILLSPGVNIFRSTLCGRNFEYLGEDPLLAGRMVAALVDGTQSEGVLATVKHFACNNQEYDRNWVSSEVDERTMREIYLPAFKAAVQQGRVSCVMTAYNMINGVFCSHHPWLLDELLRTEWGFAGFVMSDWVAVHDGLAAAKCGVDIEMPTGANMRRDNLTAAIKDGQITEAMIDNKVRRILRTIIAAGFLDRAQRRDDLPLDNPDSDRVSLEGARQGMVLLKNDRNLLPLDCATLKTIAVIGPNAHPAVFGGSGSAYTIPFHSVSVLDGMKQAVSGRVEILYHSGRCAPPPDELYANTAFDGPVQAEYFSGTDLQGAPVSVRSVSRIGLEDPGNPPVAGLAATNYSVRWTARIKATDFRDHTFITEADDGIRVLIDGRKILDNWYPHPVERRFATANLNAGTHTVVVEYFQAGGGAVARFGWGLSMANTNAVVETARKADVVIACVGFGQYADTGSYGMRFDASWPEPWIRAQTGLAETEDSDRTFDMAPQQVELLKMVTAANPRTVVVLNAAGAVNWQGWLEKVPALLVAWYPGQEGGRAVADILLGTVNPSGKLPATFEKRWEDSPCAPYYLKRDGGKTYYTDSVFVGYRGYDQNKVEPQFCFGYGLSYTTFAYDKLQTVPVTNDSFAISFDVKNTGTRDGAEIAQVYVTPPAGAVPRPPKELKGFAKVMLKAGETRQVTVNLARDAFVYWHPEEKTWTLDSGVYGILVGASSRDIRLSGSVTLASP